VEKVSVGSRVREIYMRAIEYQDRVLDLEMPEDIQVSGLIMIPVTSDDRSNRA
jgi:hypothetical protein